MVAVRGKAGWRGTRDRPRLDGLDQGRNNAEKGLRGNDGADERSHVIQMTKSRWIKRVRAQQPARPTETQKATIVAACEAYIRDVLKPRFLPEICPTEFNYAVDITGDWRAGKYRFIQRYRSGMPHALGEEFDAPFARLDFIGPDRFDIHWMRHTGQWWLIHSGVSLAEALGLLESNPILHPH